MQQILIADDDPIERNALVSYIKKWGYDVIAVDDGYKAVQRASVFKPDLIVMDYILPRLTGLDAAAEIRKMPDRSEVPIILISSFCEEILMQECNQIANIQFLEKPFEFENLKTIIDSILTH